jgi:translocation and assembly module TamB
LQGTIEFNNPFETEATFEVRARTEIRRYTIDMRFSGSLTRGVDFDYTSTPTLSDLELFNLLAFGEEPASSTLQDRDRYQQALGLQATRYLTDTYFSEVESGARRLFGVDRFRISPTISGKETDATARVTLGKRINRNVYLTYSRLLSTSEDQLITVEYQLSRRVRVKGTRDEDGSFGIDFLVQQRIRR